jgi:hypothetical protein
MKAKIGRSYLTEIPHEGGKLAFQYPAFKGTFGEVAEQIDKEGLKRPTSPEVASLVYDAWKNPKGEYESQVLGILRRNWIWEFIGNLYIPKSNDEINNGVIIEYNPKIVKGKLSMNKSSLVKRLNESDLNVKFVPFGYNIKSQTLKEFGENPYIVARYGEEGAEKIAEIASKYSSNPYLWSFDSVDEETVRVSALFNYLYDGRLDVCGDVRAGDSDGCSFGVSVAD